MPNESSVDVALIGAGIMSATLGALLRQLDPTLRLAVFERLDRVSAESSDAWNNAGTGHAGYCELNYTPERPDGSVDASKAVAIARQFHESLAFWRALEAAGELPKAETFLRRVPHVSFVWGERDVAFLRARFAALRGARDFEAMSYTERAATIEDWAPLVMEGRSREEPVAATRVEAGTDVNFGALARAMVASIERAPGNSLHLSHQVDELRRDGARWRLELTDRATGEPKVVHANFVFIGAGGYSLLLLEKSGIPEAQGYGAFPVSGQWLRCTDPAVIARHHAKVYGRAQTGAPPMSVPHLDTRWIDGRQELLFGPYAGVTTKFLQQGSWLDLLSSIGVRNVGAVIAAGVENLDLTAYLGGQALLSVEERVELLRRYYPAALEADWELQIAGLRVQIIRSDGRGGGELKFGTELVASQDGSIAALLGASPGASTAVSIMLELLQRCFPARWASAEWQRTIARLLPSRA